MRDPHHLRPIPPRRPAPQVGLAPRVQAGSCHLRLAERGLPPTTGTSCSSRWRPVPSHHQSWPWPPTASKARIERLVGAVESGVFTADEVAAKLNVLRERRDRAKAVLAAGEGQTGRLDVGAIARLLDELGGLVAVADLLTDDERKAIFAQSNLSGRDHAPTRTARFVTDLGRG
jgi:hypothetical protein